MHKTILYVEDNPTNRELMACFMEGQPYQLVEAYNAKMALDILAGTQVDLILMDIDLPVIDGLELTHMIRENPVLSHIPIIAVTANAMSGDKRMCLEAGCDDYISKPIMRIELFNKIRFNLNSESNTQHNLDKEQKGSVSPKHNMITSPYAKYFDI